MRERVRGMHTARRRPGYVATSARARLRFRVFLWMRLKTGEGANCICRFGRGAPRAGG